MKFFTVLKKKTAAVSKLNKDFDIGDFVWVNTNKFGLVFAQIISVEDYSQGNTILKWYTLDVRGKIVTYVDSDEIFATKSAADSSDTKITV